MYFSTDLEGRTDDKIRIMEQVEELRAKRADRQVSSSRKFLDLRLGMVSDFLKCVQLGIICAGCIQQG